MAITSTISRSNISTIDNNNNHDNRPNRSPTEDRNRSPVGSRANRSFNSIDLDYEDDPPEPWRRSTTPGQAVDCRGLGYNNRGNDEGQISRSTGRANRVHSALDIIARHEVEARWHRGAIERWKTGHTQDQVLEV